MKLPLTISWHRIPPDPIVELEVREYVDRLEHFYSDIMACRVLIEVPHRHQVEGRLHHVRIDLTVPGGELVVRRDPSEHLAHKDLHVALRDSFRAARGMLQDWARERRGQAKLHDEVLREGHIERVFPDDGYGFIAPRDGEASVYFHEHALDGATIGDCEAGAAVRYAVEEGVKGPQAVVVHLARPALRQAREHETGR
jgi:cold shock CspA family protein